MLWFLKKQLLNGPRTIIKGIKEKLTLGNQRVTINHLVTLRVIVQDCKGEKEDLIGDFIDFRKVFYIVPKSKLKTILEEICIPFNPHRDVIRFYKKVIAKIKYNKEWPMDISRNIVIKQGSPFLPPLLESISIKLRNI